MDELKQKIAELEKQVAELQQRRIRVTDIIPGSITPRALSATEEVSEGDLYYSNGTFFIRIPPGEEGQVLTITNGIPTWETP